MFPSFRSPPLSPQLALNNDASQWERAMQMPHYNANDMPSLSIFQVLHLVQMARSGRFQLYDYGSRSGNLSAYGSVVPPDLAARYSLLQGLPVDLVAGSRDGIIPPANIRIHYERMRDAGLDVRGTGGEVSAPVASTKLHPVPRCLQVTYKEFAFGHLDFTFAVKEDLKLYLIQRLKKK